VTFLLFLGDRNLVQTSPYIKVVKAVESDSKFCAKLLIPCILSKPFANVSLEMIRDDNTSSLSVSPDAYSYNKHAGFSLIVCTGRISQFICRSGQENISFVWEPPPEKSAIKLY